MEASREGSGRKRRQFLKHAWLVAGGALLGAAGCKQQTPEHPTPASAPRGRPRRRPRPQAASEGVKPPPAGAEKAPLELGARSKVCIVRSGKLVISDFELNRDVACDMLNRALCELTGKSDAKAAWLSVFDPTDVIGLKVNCLAGPRFSTHPDMVMAIIRCLADAGVPQQQTIVWDRKDSELAGLGYEICYEPTQGKPLCYGTNAPGAGYDEPTSSGSWSGRLSRILTQHVNVLINCPVAKDHGVSGVTLAMKNHYGSIDNPGQYHGDKAQPGIADLNAHPAIRNRTRLIVMDLVHGVCQGGPGGDERYAFNEEGFLVSQDPVAADAMAWDIIDRHREKNGLPRLAECGREPRHIALAESLGLGHAASSNIELREVVV